MPEDCSVVVAVAAAVAAERRRSSKHLALLDAMRKLAKKRETMLQKQQHGKISFPPLLFYLEISANCLI